MSENENKKESGKFSSFLQKASDVSKKAADGIQKGVKDLSDKTREELYAQRLKKYNPLSTKEYKSKGYVIPDIIQIVDNDELQKIDVCDGAIAWRDRSGEVEVLHLSDEWIKNSGIEFIPSPKCNEVYGVDPNNSTRYIQADCIFNKAHEERMAELEHIAYMLGAKSCSIEIVESESQIDSTGLGVKAKGINLSANAESKKLNKRSGRAKTVFEGNTMPRRPELKWFVNDENIKLLIEMRCSDNNAVKSRELVLEGSSSATMSKKMACTIDGLLKSASMERQATQEHSSKLVFKVEF